MKTYSTSTRNQFYADNFIAVDLVEIHLATPLYLTNSHWTIQYDSTTAPTAGVNSYTPQGDFIGFSTVSEDFDVRVGKFSIYLSALGPSFINNFVDFTEQQKINVEGCRVVIYKAFLNPSAAFAIVDNPIIMFDGVIYNVAVQETSATASITLDCATLFADFERIAGRKTNNGSNWLFLGYTNDNSFEKASFVGQQEFKWGKV
jgi:hypothetical protein